MNAKSSADYGCQDGNTVVTCFGVIVDLTILLSGHSGEMMLKGFNQDRDLG
jgi:hypothetical protein